MEPVLKESFVERLQRQSQEHLAEAGENYAQHLWFTAQMGLSFLITGISIIMHGFVPAVLKRTASQRIERTYHAMKKRGGDQRMAKIDTDWQI